MTATVEKAEAEQSSVDNKKKQRIEWKLVWPPVSLTIFGLTVGWFGSVLDNEMPLGLLFSIPEPTMWHEKIFYLLISIAAMVGAGYTTYRAAMQFIPVRNLHKKTFEPKKGIMLFVSTMRFGAKIEGDEFVVYKNEKKDELRIPLTQNIDDDIQAMTTESKKVDLDFQISWQQTLRTLQPHLDTLEQIYLIYSKQSDEQLDAYKSLLQRYLKRPDRRITLITHDKYVSFEELRDINDALQQGLDKLRNGSRKKLKDREIILDITAGQKTTSVAGAFFTLHHPDLDFQYVAKDTITFNVVNTLPTAG